MKNKAIYTKGFTLIELLVVIALIGILASVILVSLNSARGKGRDAYRASTIAELQKALELYYNDYGVYPSTGIWRSATCNNWGGGPYATSGGASAYIPNLAPTYIPVLPSESGGYGGCGYIYNSNGTDYFVMAWGTYEGITPPSKLRPLVGAAEKDYTSYSPGAANW
jgi:prepilin-type N-terminal cleavage/methylation domain-containing protein